MIRVAFLVPENKRCGVRDYSDSIFSRLARKKGLEIEKVFYAKRNSPFYYCSLARRLSGYDAVHLQHEFALFGLFGANFLFFALACKKPLAVTFHEFHTESALTFLKEKIITSFSSSRIGAAIVLSGEAEKKATQFFSKEKVFNTGFGFEMKKGNFGPKAGKLLVVHPGFVRPNKNQLFTLEVARLLPEVEFVIAGGGRGDYFDKVASVASELRNARVTGFLDAKKYAEIMKKAGIVLLPYTKVVQSAAFYDALSYGKPVLASDLGFFREMAAKGVCLTSPLLPEKFSEKIAQIRRDRFFNKKFSVALRIFSADNSFDKVADRIARMYKKLS